MTQEQKEELDKKIEALKPKILKAKDVYDSLLDEMSELLDQRYPERREEAIRTLVAVIIKKVLRNRGTLKRCQLL